MDGKVVIGVELATKSFEKQIKQTEQELTALEAKSNKLAELNAKAEGKSFRVSSETYQELQKLGIAVEDIGNKETFSKLEQQIEKTKNKLVDLNEKQDELNNKDNSKIVNSLKKVGSETGNILKKVAKWGLAIFSIRSAYMLVRQAVSTLSNYNEQIGTDIQYIRFALASALQPIIEKIIQLVYKLLAYVGYLAKAWFGVELFANASAKAFQKVNKGVKDTNKSAQKLQKTLAGFDEMNILQDTGATTTGGGGGGVSLPSTDLSKELTDIPEWLERLGESGSTVLKIIEAIGIAFAAWKLLKLINEFSTLSSLLSSMSGWKILGVMIGLATAIWGVVEVIQALTSDTIHFEDILKGLSDVLIGIGIIMVSLNTSNPFGWITIGIGLLGNLISSLIDTRTDVEKLEEANKNLEEAQRGVNDAYQEYVNASKTHLNAYKNYEKAQKELEKTAKKLGITTDELTKRGSELYDEIREHPEKIAELSDKDKLLYEAYLNVIDAEARLKTSEDKLITSEQKLTEAQQNEIVKQLDKQKVLADSSKKYEEYRDAVIDAYEKGAISGEEATGRITYALANTDKESKQVFVDGIPGYIQDMMTAFEKSTGGLTTKWRSATDDMKIYTDSLAGKFNSRFGTDIPKSVQKSVDKVKKLRDELSKLVSNGAVSISTSVKSVIGKGNAKGAIYYPPKLAVGGIINQPGRGVPLALGGERGAEGVIPLTDSQAMSTLGQIIAKNISVNLNNTIEMNGRVISRELKQIQNDENFAFNGG